MIAFVHGGVSANSWSVYPALERLQSEPGVGYLLFDRRGRGCSGEIAEANSAEEILRTSHFTGESVARDLEAIRKVLFSEKLFQSNSEWIVIGHSYGGTVAEWYLNLFPESAKVVHISSFYVSNDALSFVRSRALALKRSEDEFVRLYPDVPALITQLRTQIKPDRCFSKLGTTVCGPAIIDSLGILLSLGKESWPGLYKTLNEIDVNRLDAFADEHFFKMYAGNSQLSAAIEKADQTPGYTATQASVAVLDEFRKQGLDPDQWLFSELRLNIAIDFKLKKEFDHFLPKQVLSNELTRKTLKDHPKAKLVRHLGEEDSIASPSEFSKQKDILKSMYQLHVYPGRGHRLYTTAEFWRNVLTT